MLSLLQDLLYKIPGTIVVLVNPTKVRYKRGDKRTKKRWQRA